MSERFESMIENSGWIRGLARELLYDPTMVDDVVQEVWITAWQSPPRKEQPAARRSWLKKVVISMAKRANRSRLRRSRWESEAANGDAHPTSTPQQMLERLEMQSRLAQAVSSLKEPYRRIIFLRYYENVSVSAIAFEFGVPESTIRTQLSRAVARLRDRLDSELGERDWRALLLPIAFPSGLAGRVSSTAGRSASSASWTSYRTWIGFACLVALIAIGFMAFRDSKQRATSEAATANARLESRSMDQPVTATPTLPEPAPTKSLATVVSMLPSSTATSKRDVDTIAASRHAEHPFQVLDECDDSPIYGAEVFVFLPDRSEGIRVGDTDSNGMISVAISTLCRAAIAVTRDGYVEYREPTMLRDLDGAAYVVRMRRSFDAIVRVVDPSGEPIAGIPITVGPPSEEQQDQLLSTDRAGEIRYPYRFYDTEVSIDVPGYSTVALPAETPRMEITLVPGVSRRGRVVDDRGEPVRECTIIITGDRHRRLARTYATDDNGEFDLGSVAKDERLTLDFYPAHFSTSRQIVVGSGATDTLTFTLPSGRSIEGIVRDPDGAPVTAAYVFITERRAAPRREGGNIPRVRSPRVSSRRTPYRLQPLLRARTDADGHFRVGPIHLPTAQELARDAVGDERTLFLLVCHARWVNQVRALLTPETDLEIQLEHGDVVRGRVSSTNGRPLEGVHLHFGESYTNAMESVLGRVRTGPDGRFEMAGIPSTRDEAIVSTNGCATATRREHVFVTAFEPDILLDVDGEPIASSAVKGAHVIAPGSGELAISAAVRDHGLNAQVRLLDEAGLPIHTWTPTLLLGPEGEMHRGVLGRNLHDPAFFTDHVITVRDLWRATAYVMADHYLWVERHLTASDTPVELELERRPHGRSQLLAKARTTYGVGIPFDCGSQRPRAIITLGVTDDDGALFVDMLEPGTYHLYVAVTERSRAVTESEPFDADAWIHAARIAVTRSPQRIDLR